MLKTYRVTRKIEEYVEIEAESAEDARDWERIIRIPEDEWEFVETHIEVECIDE